MPRFKYLQQKLFKFLEKQDLNFFTTNFFLVFKKRKKKNNKIIKKSFAFFSETPEI